MIVNFRLLQEERERQMLSPYACFSSDSKGRKRAEEKCFIRTEFQRDRDRIIYCKAFRRLKHKTQVFIAPEGDHFRTRLTHTLEVMQISRTLARALSLNEDLTEAIALGHDLGHSPFGHAGEVALDKAINSINKKAHFRHNEQSLRVVDFLEGKGGLNLTFEVRNGILTHTKGRSPMFAEEKGYVGEDKPVTLEAEIVRISDRLAYINHDIDDALRAGIVSEKDIPSECVKVVGDSTSKRINTMVLDIIEQSYGKPYIKMSDRVEKAVERLKEFMFERVYVGSVAKAEEDKAKELIKKLFSYFMEHREEIPATFIASHLNLDVIEERARAVCDYVAGMTDRYALTIFKRIFLPKGWQL
jgi:dGTPase